MECRLAGNGNAPRSFSHATAAASSHPNGNRAEATGALSFVLKPGVAHPTIVPCPLLLIPSISRYPTPATFTPCTICSPKPVDSAHLPNTARMSLVNGEFGPATALHVISLPPRDS